MTTTDQFFAHLENGDLPAALDAFGDVSDRDAAVDVLLDVCDDLDVNDFDTIEVGLRLCDLVIATDPERADAHLWKLAALSRRGAFDDAFAFASEHRARGPVLVELYEMACVHGRDELAAQLLDDLRALGEPEAGMGLYNLGCKLHQGGNLDRAVALYRGSIAAGSPRPQAHINAGIALLSGGRAGEAAALARDGLEHEPRDPNLWSNLLDAVSRDPNDAVVREGIAGALPILGNSSRCDECTEHVSILDCSIGCNALMVDVMNAMIAVGDARAANDLWVSHYRDGVEPTIHLLCARARALAADGKADEAHAVLDAGLEGGDSFGFYRARAAAAWAGGDTDRAIGALAAALHVDPRGADVLKRDAAWQALDGIDLTGTPIRPPSVPAAARWDAGDNEWVVGELDADGNKQGLWKYYRPDGTLANECPMVDDEPHGPFKRFHENGDISQEGAFERGQLHGTRIWRSTIGTTTEKMRTEDMSEAIRRSEMDYDNGRVTEIRHYDAAGKQCAPDGTPYPDRPEGVAERAFYRPDEGVWRYGELDAEGAAHGTWRNWNNDGALLLEEDMAGGERHGAYRELFPDGTLAAEGRYEEGSAVGTIQRYRHADGTAPEGFPTAGSKVVRVDCDHEKYVTHYRYYDAEGRETMLDGTPLDTFGELHPGLGTWLEDVRAIDWSSLEDASDDAHFVPQILINLLAADEGDTEAISDSVYGDLYWHLCHQGSIYDGTAAAIPFIVRLLGYDKTPHKPALLSFLKNTACAPPHIVERARAEQEGWSVFLSTYDAIMEGVDLYLALLAESDDVAVRTMVTRVLGSAYDRAAEVTSALIAAANDDADETVRNSALYALGRMDTDAARERLAATISDPGLPGVCAALATVMARGPESGDAVLARLVQALKDVDDYADAYGTLAWADDELVAELGQALAYAGGGAPVLARLTAAFDTIDSMSALSLVKASLDIAYQLGDGELTDEMRHVLAAIARSEKPWTFNVNLFEILDEYELPRTKEELLAIAQS